MTDADVLVAGGGPAGVAAAITAARAGRRVVLADKARFPRDKTCGDGLTAMALRLLETLGVNVPSLPGYQPVTTTVIVDPSGRHILLPHPGDGHHAGVVRRTELDAALLARAREAGVDVREGATVSGAETCRGGMTVRLGDATVRAPWVVAADGHWSTLRRSASPDRARDLGEWHAVRQYFDGVSDRRLWVIFDRALLPGYAWVFPLPGGAANVGYGVLRSGRSGAALRELWPRVLALPALRAVLGADARPAGPMRAWPIPTRYAPERLVAGRTLFAGDAAGVVDPLTGEGIAQALESGRLAARAIVAGGCPADVGARFRASVARELGADLRFSAALQRLLGRPATARAAFAAVGATGWTRRNVARWLWEDYPRALLLTPGRWSPGMLRPPGAFRAA
jgi:geranylgeranyl reductase family protein